MRPPPPPQQPLPGREYFPTHQPPPRRNGRPVPAVEDSRAMGHSRALAGRNDELDGRKGSGPGDGLLGPNPVPPMGPPMSGGGGLQVQGPRGGGTYHGRRDVESGRGEGWGEGRVEREGVGRGEDGGGRMILEESRGVVLYGEGERRKAAVGDRRPEDGRDGRMDGRHEAGAGAGRGPPSMGREGGREMGVADRGVAMGGGRMGAPSAERMREERGSERGVMRDGYREVEGRPRVGNAGREEERKKDGERRGFDDDRGWGRAQRDVAFGGRSHENMGSRREEPHLKPSPAAAWGSAEASGRVPGGGGPGGESRNNTQMGSMVRGSRVADAKEHRGEWGGGEWGAERRSPDVVLSSGSARTDVPRYAKEGEERKGERGRSRDRVTKFSPPTLHPRGVPPPPGADARYSEGGGGPVRERQRRETQFSGPPPGLQRFNHPPHPIPSLDASPAGGWSGERAIHGGGGPRAERPERGSGFSGGFSSGPPSAELARMRDEGSGRGGGAGVMSGVRLGPQEGDRPRPRTGFPSPLPPPPHSMPRFLPQGLPPGPPQLREWEREERGGDRGRGRGRGGGRGGGDGRDERDGGRMAEEGGRQDPNRCVQPYSFTQVCVSTDIAITQLGEKRVTPYPLSGILAILAVLGLIAANFSEGDGGWGMGRVEVW